MSAGLPADWVQLRARQRDILIALAICGPSHGYQVHEFIDAPDTTASTTYRNAAELQDRGLIDHEMVNDKEGEYSLTDAGERLVHEWAVAVDRLIENVVT